MDLKDANKNFYHSNNYSCSRFLLITLVLFQLFFCFNYYSFISRKSLAGNTTAETPTHNVSDSYQKDETCPSGRVYVYDLPPMFNKEMLENCSSLDPWSPRYCDAVLNGGFGRRATEIAGVVPASLAPAWYWTDQFMLEVIFHNRVLKHRCRTLEPESATAFYIPFYAGLTVGRYLFTSRSSKERDRDCEMLLM